MSDATTRQSDDTVFMLLCWACGHPGFAREDVRCAYCGTSREDNDRAEIGDWSEWGD